MYQPISFGLLHVPPHLIEVYEMLLVGTQITHVLEHLLLKLPLLRRVALQPERGTISKYSFDVARLVVREPP